MKRFLQILILLVVMIIVTGALPQAAFAAESCATIGKNDMRNIKSQGYDQNDGQGNPTVFPSEITDGATYTPFSIVFTGDFNSAVYYYLSFRRDIIAGTGLDGNPIFAGSTEISRVRAEERNGTRLVFNLTKDVFKSSSNRPLLMSRGDETISAFIELWQDSDGDRKCEYRRYKINPIQDTLECAGILAKQNGSSSCFTDQNISFEIAPVFIEENKPFDPSQAKVQLKIDNSGTFSSHRTTVTDNLNSSFEYVNSTTLDFKSLVKGQPTYIESNDFIDHIEVGSKFKLRLEVEDKTLCESEEIEIFSSCDTSELTPDNRSYTNGSPTIIIKNYAICDQIPESNHEAKELCGNCLDGKGDFSDPGIWTSLGCIPKSPTSMIRSLVFIGMSLAGGVALIMILIAAFTLSTSMGDPNKVTNAKEMLTSAIIGLLFIIFSVTILQFVGVSVLQIPGFGGA